jgi:hypothetical protein
MRTYKTKGLIAAPFTPMHADCSINLDAIEDYAPIYQKVIEAFAEGDRQSSETSQASAIKMIDTLIAGGQSPIATFKWFMKRVGVAYDTIADTWQTINEVPVGHVTTTMLEWRGRFVIPSGEIRPGKRSPEVWSIQHIAQ